MALRPFEQSPARPRGEVERATPGAAALRWTDLSGVAPEELEEWVLLGRGLGRAGRYQEAREVFGFVVQRAPTEPMALAGLGLSLQALGEYVPARRAFDEALTLVKDHLVALVCRGELRLGCGDPGGLADLLLAATADPSGVTDAGRHAAARLDGKGPRAAPGSGARPRRPTPRRLPFAAPPRAAG